MENHISQLHFNFSALEANMDKVVNYRNIIHLNCVIFGVYLGQNQEECKRRALIDYLNKTERPKTSCLHIITRQGVVVSVCRTEYQWSRSNMQIDVIFVVVFILVVQLFPFVFVYFPSVKRMIEIEMRSADLSSWNSPILFLEILIFYTYIGWWIFFFHDFIRFYSFVISNHCWSDECCFILLRDPHLFLCRAKLYVI